MDETAPAPPPRKTPFVPPALEAYEILDELGVGSAGHAYKARHKRLNRLVAIKFLHRSTEISQKRFLREAQVLASLDHPRIVTVHDCGEHEGKLYMVLEFVEGGSVRDLIDRENQVDIDQCLNILRGVLDGLSAAHERGILHRDIKPANILLTEEREVKIADFGIAKLLDSVSETRVGITVGTPLYMAPEQFHGVGPQVPTPTNARCDLYSLGVLLHEMLTGHTPFGTPKTLRELVDAKRGVLPSPRLRRPDVPDWLAEVTQVLTASDPDARYESAAAALEAIEQAGGSKASTAPRVINVALRIPSGDHEVILRPGQKLVLGRSSQRADLAIPDHRLSRAHCEMRFIEGGGVWLRDLGSSNGTQVNGKTLTTRQNLFHHDRIVIGDTTIDFECRELDRETAILQCSKCHRPIPPRDIVQGQARIKDGAALICASCPD